MKFAATMMNMMMPMCMCNMSMFSSCREFDAPFRLTDGWRMKAIPPAEPTAIVGEAASKRCRHPLFFARTISGKERQTS